MAGSSEGSCGCTRHRIVFTSKDEVQGKIINIKNPVIKNVRTNTKPAPTPSTNKKPTSGTEAHKEKNPSKKWSNKKENKL